MEAEGEAEGEETSDGEEAPAASPETGEAAGKCEGGLELDPIAALQKWSRTPGPARRPGGARPAEGDESS